MIKKSDDYYGVNVGSSKSVVFLVDISGSMEGKAEVDAQGKVISKTTQKVTNKIADKVGGVGGNFIRKQTNNNLTKLGKAKKELIPAIRGLNETTQFNIIIFENDVKTWRKELVLASQANKNLAIAYINKLESGGGTNIYGSLDKAFKYAGSNVSKQSGSTNVETIFLLSDGSPSAGSITNTDKLCQKTKQWNPYNVVTINTIGLGEDCDKTFMEKLAKENNGVFIDK